MRRDESSALGRIAGHVVAGITAVRPCATSCEAWLAPTNDERASPVA